MALLEGKERIILPYDVIDHIMGFFGEHDITLLLSHFKCPRV